MEAPMPPPPEAAGTIYDIGYRRYDGPRLGRRGAIAAIVWAGVRAAFGLGRSARSKILPWGSVLLAIIPAVVAVAIRVLVGDVVDLYSYENYLWQIGALFPIFLAAQTPELVVNDMRYRVLPLYFSRPISRADYVGAKLAALSLAVLAIALLPVLVLFVGRILSADDALGALGDELASLPAIVGSGLLHAAVLSVLALAIASVAGRRAYAAAAILAIFLVGGAMSAAFQEQGGTLEAVAPFLSPLAILDGVRSWLWAGTVGGSPAATAGVPGPVYALATLVLVGVAAAILAVRYRSATP
jgi:ABC-2 type transport system permease protein